ncbi:hypothetical protein HAX54_031700 [Datura stramonium]|uniref:Uncharacterized protein n=1 Tax=Datura stramonium TaxID=4076 RepID=A0ABS8V9X4_DATST|nr:hypothetical protein [Datura stramonium]
MNYKAFYLLFIAFFLSSFCLFSTTSSSRRLLSGSGGSKIGMTPHYSPSGPSATQQSPPALPYVLPTSRPCNYENRCKKGTP